MTRPRRAPRIVTAVLTAAAAAAAPASRPNVLLVIFDDLRPALEPYGAPGAYTPNLQALASSAGATTFLNACVCTLPLPAPHTAALPTPRPTARDTHVSLV